jgi:hypothetical protein
LTIGGKSYIIKMYKLSEKHSDIYIKYAARQIGDYYGIPRKQGAFMA